MKPTDLPGGGASIDSLVPGCTYYVSDVARARYYFSTVLVDSARACHTVHADSIFDRVRVNARAAL